MDKIINLQQKLLQNIINLFRKVTLSYDFQIRHEVRKTLKYKGKKVKLEKRKGIYYAYIPIDYDQRVGLYKVDIQPNTAGKNNFHFKLYETL